MLDYLYDNEDSICGLKYNGTPYYFYKNLQGDIIAITEKDGKVVAKYSYDAWGVCTITQDTSGIASVNPIRYRGYYYDVETGFAYVGSRYYDPEIGRWINADDANMIMMAKNNVLSANLFTYCNNNFPNDDDNGGMLSFGSILSVFSKILNGVKMIVDFIMNLVRAGIKLYTGLDWKDISSLAKDIGRSPKRVREAIESLTKKLTKVKNKLGKLAIAITVISLVVYVSSQFYKLGNIVKTIAMCVVDGLIAGITFVLTQCTEALAKLIPGIGFIISIFAGWGASMLLDWFFSGSFVSKIKNKYESRINPAKFQLKDYFTTFITCIIK